MAYELVWEPCGVYNGLSGFVSASEFLASAEEMLNAGAFHKARYVINDFSAVSAHELSGEAWDRLANLYCAAHQRNPNCRIFFVTRDEALARLVINYSVDDDMGSYEVVLATTLAQARHCLDVRPARCCWAPRKFDYRSFLAR